MRVAPIALALLALLAVHGTVARAAPAPEAHLRVSTVHGPIHVWTPSGYDPKTAATIVYVHGYFTTADDAYHDYRLRDQFAESGVNAMFVVCEAPWSDRDDVAWSSLADLLHAVAAHAPLPAGREIAIAHSGAHRVIDSWLADPALDAIVLLDAGYGRLSAYADWLDAQPGRRLIDVADLTKTWTDPFHATLPDSFVVQHFPPASRGALPSEANDAAIVYVRSDMGHMPLVTRGIAIPMVLRALAVPLVAHGDRSAPLAPFPDR